MPPKRLLALLFCLIVLTGCSGQRDPTQCALDFRTGLMEAGGCSFLTEVTAHYAERAYVFTLSCDCRGGKTTLTVTEPECIAGIQAVVESGETQLEYEDVLLDYGTLANGYVAPVAAPWLLVQCWTEAYIAFVGADGPQQRITYLCGFDDGELSVDTWLQDGIPTYAEVTHEGTRCLTAVISDFQSTPAGGRE